jgi:hypothetical protein
MRLVSRGGNRNPCHPDEFIAKWKAVTLKERSAAQKPFIT